MANNKELKKFEAPNLKYIDDGFLTDNEQLSEFNAPNLEYIGDDFLSCNKELKRFEAPNLTHVGKYFLYVNEQLSEFNVPNLSKESKESLEYLFSVVKENSKGGKTQNIDSTDIAKLDKKYNITTSEIERSRKSKDVI